MAADFTRLCELPLLGLHATTHAVAERRSRPSPHPWRRLAIVGSGDSAVLSLMTVIDCSAGGILKGEAHGDA